MADITIGRYYEKNSIIHEIDVRVKLAFIIVYITLCLVSVNWLMTGFLGLILMSLILLCRISPKAILKSIKNTAIIIFIGSFINAFTSDGRVILDCYILQITDTGLNKAAFVFFKLIFITLSSVLFVYTTKPMEILKGLKTGFNIKSEYAMIITIAIRFIPILSEELRRIRMAQKMRGLELEKGKAVKRLKSSVAVIIPLFQAAISRSEIMADAMDVRCYTGGEERTELYPLKYRKSDYMAFIIIMLMVGVCITIMI